MEKEKFLLELRRELYGLPKEDIEERLSFYSEMIDDHMEEGLSEEEAVAAVGSIDEIVKQTIADIPLGKLVKERIKPNRTLRGWEILLLILGFPLWFPLVIVCAALLFTAYAVIWSVDLCLWAVDLSFGVCAFGGVILAIANAAQGFYLPGLSMFAIGIFCAGASIFTFYGCLVATKGFARLTLMTAHGVKRLFIKKEKER